MISWWWSGDGRFEALVVNESLGLSGGIDDPPSDTATPPLHGTHDHLADDATGAAGLPRGWR